MKHEFKGFRNIFGYCAGMAGWSIMLNTVAVMLVYFYLPPSNSGMSQLIPNKAVIGILTVFSLVLASGRIIDAVTDPLIAWFSDRLNTRWGRRVPFIFLAIIPTGIFSILLFYPPFSEENAKNINWLFFIQAGYFIFLTLYIVPYNALMPDLAKTRDQKLNLSMYLSLSYVLGIIVASQVPLLADRSSKALAGANIHSYREAIIIVNSIAVLLMFLPVLVVDENKYCRSKPSTISVFSSLKKVINDRFFLLFLIADSSFFITIAIISSGVLYYVKVLLGLREMIGSYFLGGMIFISLLSYPLVVKLAKVKGKKMLVLFSFAIYGLLFIWISLMGKLPLSPYFQLGVVAVFGALPAAVLGILPYAIIAESAERSYKKTGQKTEAMFFAVRTFADKFGQTLGITGFAILLIFGKDPQNDLGIRLTAWMGFAVCALAFAVFWFWEE